MCSLYYNATWKYTTTDTDDTTPGSQPRCAVHGCRYSQHAASCCRSYWLCLLSSYLYTFSVVRFSSSFFCLSGILLFVFRLLSLCRVRFELKTVTSLAGRVVVVVVVAASDDKTSAKHVSCRARTRIAHSRLCAHWLRTPLPNCWLWFQARCCCPQVPP